MLHLSSSKNNICVRFYTRWPWIGFNWLGLATTAGHGRADISEGNCGESLVDEKVKSSAERMLQALQTAQKCLRKRFGCSRVGGDRPAVERTWIIILLKQRNVKSVAVRLTWRGVSTYAKGTEEFLTQLYRVWFTFGEVPSSTSAGGPSLTVLASYASRNMPLGGADSTVGVSHSRRLAISRFQLRHRRNEQHYTVITISLFYKFDTPFVLCLASW
jgi:hypothetical protein